MDILHELFHRVALLVVVTECHGYGRTNQNQDSSNEIKLTCFFAEPKVSKANVGDQR